ncbi:MAG TPA: hypothetical protein VKK81_17970 [Candidatus Binatia bacterium]|nr:hypothetical protein [Candidatus Binatia bacterium]
MRRKMLRSISLPLTSILCLMVLNQAALAGPPLVCHPFEIGNARSLPWSGGSGNWNAPDKNYDINRLVEDTMALLTPGTPVLVRMETIRRATIYAVWPDDYKVGNSAKHVNVASELLARLEARVPDAGAKSDKNTTALALFDYGCLVESYKQASWGSPKPSLAAGIDGYAMIIKAIALRSADPEMEFAAALACMGKKREEGQGAYVAHLQKAAAGTQEGSLLAQNLLRLFSDKGKTIAELRANVARAKN